MMKLEQATLNQCTYESCTQNEFIVMPDSGDVGLAEYINHKASLIADRKHLTEPLEQNILMLEYPGPDTQNASLFSLFFDSPNVVACRRVFEGCFAVDVTKYLQCPDHIQLLNLLAYMKSNPDTVFALFVYTNNLQLADSFYQKVVPFIRLVKSELPLPSTKQLSEYVVESFREKGHQIDWIVLEQLERYFATHNLAAYDTAEQLIERLQSENLTRKINTLENELKLISNTGSIDKRFDRFGY